MKKIFRETEIIETSYGMLKPFNALEPSIRVEEVLPREVNNELIEILAEFNNNIQDPISEEDLLEATVEAHDKILKMFTPKYQVCLTCNGSGAVQNKDATSLWTTCPTCYGNRYLYANP